MDVRNCPSCGSDDISRSSGSAEYSSWTKWSCEDCGWSYKKGRGMGVGSGSSGDHPKRTGPGRDQSTLTEVGQYCGNCETVIAGEHVCTAEGYVEQADGPVTQEEVIDALEEFHYSGESELKDAIRNKRVALTPTFFRVIPWEEKEPDERRYFGKKDTEMFEHIRMELEQMGGECDSSDELSERLAAQNDIERQFINECLNEMGDIRVGMRGIRLIDA